MTAPVAYHLRRLAEADRPALLQLLRRCPAENRFLTGQVERHGVGGGRLTCWGVFREERLTGAALLLDASAGLAASDTGCMAELLPVLDGVENLSGECAVVDAALALLPPRRVVWTQAECVSSLPAGAFRPAPLLGAAPATDGDLVGLAALYAQSESFSRLAPGQVEEHIRRQLESSRYFVARIGDEIASAAAVVEENRGSALIVSVFTAPIRRGQGLGSAVVCAACTDILAGGGTPRLLYREGNEAAARIYGKLGFHQDGRMRMARLACPPKRARSESRALSESLLSESRLSESR